MKTLLVIGCVSIGLVVAGVIMFVASVDVDRYRPVVVNQLESALGKPVRLEHLAIGWRGGIALELKGLAISPDAQASFDRQGHLTGQATTEPTVQVESVSAVVRLLPLLRKDVQVSSVVLVRPRVHVRRDAQGHIDLMGVAALGGPAAASGRTTTVGGTPVSLHIDSLRIEDGSLHWTDAMATPSAEFWVQALDVTLKNVPQRGTGARADFQARMAVFSAAQNLHVKGRLTIPTKDRAGVLEDVRLDTDFSRLNVAQFTQALPTIKDVGLRGLAGDLTVAIDRAALDPQGLAQLAAQVRLVGGRIAFARLGSPIEELTVEALAKSGRIELKRCAARFAGGTITATGVMDHLDAQPQATLQVTIGKLALDALLPNPGPNEPQLRGRLSASFQGTGQGLALAQIAQSLSGQGRLTLSDGMIVNLNVLREVFRRLSILPGLVEKLQARLPASYQAKLTARDTVLQPIEVAMTAHDGALSFTNLRVVTDSFELTGTGRVGFDGLLGCQSTLRIDPALSAAIIKSVKELQPLTDSEGRLQLPVVIQGTLPRVAVIPDVSYVASRVVATKAEELLGNLLEKVLEKKQRQTER